MKKLLASAIFLAGFALASQAQQTPAPTKETRKEHKMKMKEELNLSSEQEAKLKNSEKGFRSKAKVIRENSSLTAEQKKESLKSLQKERMAETNTILTPEQQEKRKLLMKDSHHRKGMQKEPVTK